MLAVSFAQRAQQHTSILWEILIDHCLSDEKVLHQLQPMSSSRSAAIDGSLFGALLEAAALSGGDLAHLVKQIPPGMAIHGLRPRLVAAVADYRLKLQMRQSSSEIANGEKIELLREVAHRSRRGIRYDKLLNRFASPNSMASVEETSSGSTVSAAPNDLNILRPTQRTKRHDRIKLAYTLPIR